MADGQLGAMVVTGGSGGIGGAVARLASERGWSVCIAYDRGRDLADALVARISEGGGRAIAQQADITLETDVKRLFDAAEAAFGPITALVNSAGITGGFSTVAELDATVLVRVLAVNVTGSILCAREAVRRMSASRGGTGGGIVNVSSRAAIYGSPGEYVHYAASKGAIDSFTVGLAREVAGDGIRVNAVAPGHIHTQLHARGGDPGRVDRLAPTIPLQRGGEADEVAEAILWLLSPAASYVTGAVLPVSGGR